MKIIDKESWPRREIYEFFTPISDPFYHLTFPLNVTGLRGKCRAEGLSFYMAMTYGVVKAMERVDAFLYKDRGGVIVKHERLVPSFTDLRPGSESFYIVTLEAGGTLEEFCREAKAKSEAQTEFISQAEWERDEMVFVSCLPWFPISGFKTELDLDPCDSIPRVTWGRWREEGGATYLDLSLSLNHRMLDGVHVGRFYEELTAWIEGLQ